MLRACKYRDGLIVALFAARPIRLANMTEMTIGRQLLADNDRWLCRFTADEMKDDRPFAFYILTSFALPRDLPERLPAAAAQVQPS